MLAAWGVHHLHLSNIEGKGGFNQRGRDLLYAIFQSDDAYLLGVYTHDDWDRVGLVEVIVRNWPSAGLFLKSNVAQGQAARFTDADRRILRRANINEALIEVDGSFYGPPGLGLTAAGGSVSAARRAMAYMENLRQLRESLDDRLNAFGRELDEAAGHPVTGAWGPHVHDGQIGLLRGDDAFIGIPWLDIDWTRCRQGGRPAPDRLRAKAVARMIALEHVGDRPASPTTRIPPNQSCPAPARSRHDPPARGVAR
jgi:hypothetical protein